MPQVLVQDTLFLWKCRFKINTPDGGLNFSLHKAVATEVAAREAFTDIAVRVRSLLPSTCEIWRVNMSKDNTAKDSRIIFGVKGSGLYGQALPTDPESTFNKFDDALLVRIENVEGSGYSFPIGPVPDPIIANGEVPLPINAVSNVALAVPPPGAQPVVYATEFTNLIHAIAQKCNQVRVRGHTPGGAYYYYEASSASFVRVTRKKGARVFVK